MKNYTKSINALIVSAAALASFSAQAVSIDFLFQTPTDNSGKTSRFVNSNNTAIPGSGYFIETFDSASGGCGFMSLDPSTDIIVDQGSYGLQSGSNANGAAPAGDRTCYAFGPGASRPAGANAKVKVDYTNFLGSLPGGTMISYLGLYYGSIDTYNDIAFYNGANLITGGGGFLDDGIITGSEILAALGGTSGNQTSDKSNVYVNFTFSADEAFTAFQFRTTGIAFELDNVVTGLTTRNVPEPASLLLFSLGLLGLAGIRRKT